MVLAWQLGAIADEGLFKKGELGTEFDQDKVAQSVWRLSQAGGLSDGTIFFISPDGHFLTNWHVLQRVLNQASINSAGFTGASPLIIPVQGTQIYNSDADQNVEINQITIVAAPRQNLPWKITGAQTFLNDFVIAKVEVKPAAWLPLAKEPPKPGDKIYTAGYPGNTMRMSRQLPRANTRTQTERYGFLLGRLKKSLRRAFSV